MHQDSTSEMDRLPMEAVLRSDLNRTAQGKGGGNARRALFTAMAGIFASSQAKGQVQVGPQTPVDRVRRDNLYYLVNRASFGFTPALYSEAVQRGYEGWLDWQLNPENISDTEAEQALSAFPSVSLSAAQLYAAYGPGGAAGDPQDVVRDLRGARVVRAVRSERQLFERVVEFWGDHLNVPPADGPLQFFRTVYDSEVIRQHALGYFPDLLMASAKSAAMLIYLNGNENVAGAPNENYAREVMELHTLGVDGGYNENDIYELARCFTGWTLYPPTSSQIGDFYFNPSLHDNGSKVVMGQPIPTGGGLGDGEDMLLFLASHPSTAAYVTKKLATHLLDYDPPQALLDEAASVFLATGGHIKEVVRVILSGRWIDVVDPWNTPKISRPLHFVSSLLRTPGVELTSPIGVLNSLFVMGHLPFGWEAPDGYPDSADAWGTSVLPRWDFAYRVFGGLVPGVSASAGALYAALGSPGLSNLTERASWLLANRNLKPSEVQLVEDFVQSGVASGGEELLRSTLALIASCPSYQYL